jgi:hypothetical protein
MQLIVEALPLAALGSNLEVSTDRFRNHIGKLARTEAFVACKLNPTRD